MKEEKSQICQEYVPIPIYFSLISFVWILFITANKFNFSTQIPAVRHNTSFFLSFVSTFVYIYFCYGRNFLRSCFIVLHCVTSIRKKNFKEVFKSKENHTFLNDRKISTMWTMLWCHFQALFNIKPVSNSHGIVDITRMLGFCKPETTTFDVSFGRWAFFSYVLLLFNLLYILYDVLSKCVSERKYYPQ